MLTVTVPVPISPQELAERRAEELRRNEEMHRRAVARKNRADGKPEPRPGMSLFVSTARGIKTRGRAGLVFSEQPAELKIVDLSDEEVAAKVKAGAFIANPWGAEQILADANEPATGLVVLTSRSDAESAAKAIESASTDELEAELARRRARPRADAPERIKSSAKADETASTTASAPTPAPASKPEPTAKPDGKAKG